MVDHRLARWPLELRLAALAGVLVAALAIGAPVCVAATAPAPSSPGPALAPQATSVVSADPEALRSPPRADVAPSGHRLSAQRVLAIAGKLPLVRRQLRSHPGSYGAAFLKGPSRWQVSYYAMGSAPKEIAQVLIDDQSAAVVEAWSGFQVAWTMARGYPGAFGRRANALYVWLPLSLLFVIPFVDPRRLRSLRHLDLLALSAFSVSLAFFNHADIYASVPLAYPPLIYLLVRMLLVARVGRRSPPPSIPPSAPAPAPPPASAPTSACAHGAPPAAAGALRLLVPASWLAVAVVFLLGFRIGLNVTDSNVIDVGYAGVIGAHRLADNQSLYGHFPADNAHGDTYGPVNYEAYLPFERLVGWSGRWDDLPAAHFAAVTFDLLSVALLFALGRRWRGPPVGIVLAYAWVAYPFTLLTADSNSNDALVSVLLLAALLAAAHPARRGALAVLAGLTKFAPLALAPLLATHGLDRRPRRRLALFTVAFATVGALALAPVLAHADLATLYSRTLGFQSGRGSPFSAWGLYGGLGAVQSAVQVAAVALALAVSVLPRRRDLTGLAAAAAAVLIALQLGISHWFYLYIVWFFPLVMVALVGAWSGGGQEDLLDRVRAERARAADDHAHQPGVLV